MKKIFVLISFLFIFYYIKSQIIKNSFSANEKDREVILPYHKCFMRIILDNHDKLKSIDFLSDLNKSVDTVPYIDPITFEQLYSIGEYYDNFVGMQYTFFDNGSIQVDTLSGSCKCEN